MKTRAPFICFLIAFLITACTTTKEIKKPPPFRFVEAKLVKGIDKGVITATPLEPSTVFSTEDLEAIAYLKFENITGEYSLRWEWYDPNGKLYLSTGNYPLKIEDGKFQKEATVWHRLSIYGEKASHYPGNWQVKVYLDDKTIVSESFRIETVSKQGVRS